MAKRVIKFWDKIIVVVLGGIGIIGVFNSCLKMYGPPDAEYEINGTVTDKAKKPIQNIRVINQYNEYLGDTLYTDSKGKFYFKLWRIPRHHLKIEDIDGEKNGGEFESKEIEVEFTDKELVKRGQTNKYSKTINIELEKKK